MSRRPGSRRRRAGEPIPPFVVAVLGLIGGSVLAFGAVYPWAYVPTLVVAFGLGMYGLRHGVPRGLAGLVAVMALVLVAVAAQLFVLPAATLTRVSPATVRFLESQDVAYALAPVAGRHALSIDPGATRLGLAFLLVLFVLTIGVACEVSRTGCRYLTGGIVVIGIVVALIGIIQRPLFTGRIYGFWVPFAGVREFGPGGGPFGPFVNRNHFAGWMAMALALGLGHFAGFVASGVPDARTWRDRLLWVGSEGGTRVVLTVFGLFVMGVSLVLTLSRSGITCFIGAGTLAAAAFVVWQRGTSRRLVAVGYVVTLFVAVFATVGLAAPFARFQLLAEDGRLEVWRDTLRVIHDFPYFGTGFNTYGLSMFEYQTLQVFGHYREAHSDYLQLLAEGGVLLAVPFALLAAVLAWLVFRAFRTASNDSATVWSRVGAVAGLTAIAAQELVEFSLQMPANAVLCAVLAAIALHRPGPERSEARWRG